MEIKHPNMLERNKFLMPNIDDLKYIRPLAPPKYPEKLSRSFTAVKEEQNYQEKLSSLTGEYARFGAQLSHCPPSLKRIVQTYRYIFYTFSGLLFEDKVNKESIRNTRQLQQQKQQLAYKRKLANGRQLPFEPRNQPPSTTDGISANSLAILAAGVFVMTTYFIPFYFSHRADQMEKEAKAIEAISGVKRNTSEDEIKLVHFFGVTQYQVEFGQLKPILSAVMQMVVYVFIIESLLNFLYNFFTGGRLVCKLATIPGVHRLDTSEAFAMGKMTITFGVICAIAGIGLAVFNRTHIALLYRLVVAGEQLQLKRGMKIELLKLGVFSFMHFFHYLILSLYPLLFYYLMTIYGRAIDGISESSQTVELNEANLTKIKDKLVALNEHFKATLHYFSLPLTLAMVSNVVMITGSCCFLMINQGGSHFFISLLFGFLSYAFLRLVVVCSVGNRATNAYRELVRTLFENVRVWGIDEWMCFSEIKRMRPLFKVTFLGTYSLKQSTILAVLGFVLNYVVVLLQTESYGSAATAAAQQNGTTTEPKAAA